MLQETNPRFTIMCELWEMLQASSRIAACSLRGILEPRGPEPLRAIYAYGAPRGANEKRWCAGGGHGVHQVPRINIVAPNLDEMDYIHHSQIVK